MAEVNTEVETVESALKELLEMFPEKLITITIQAARPITAYRIQVGYRGPDHEAGTLTEAMDQIRAWHRDHKESKG